MPDSPAPRSARGTPMARAMLVASVPGRLRLREPRLRVPGCARAVAARLQGLPGVRAVDSNPAAASIRVCYAETPQATMEAAVLQAVTPLLPPPAERPGKPSLGTPPARPGSARRQAAREWNRVAKLGMLASLPVSLALAAGGAKKLHALTGGVFTALLLVHLAVHRRHLIK